MSKGRVFKWTGESRFEMPHILSLLGKAREWHQLSPSREGPWLSCWIRRHQADQPNVCGAVEGDLIPCCVSEGGQSLLWCCGQWHLLDYNHACKSMESVKTAVSWGEGGSVPVSVCGILSGQWDGSVLNHIVDAMPAWLPKATKCIQPNSDLQW